MEIFIKDSENLILKLLDNANMLVLYLDNRGYVAFSNRKVEEITGKDKKEIIGSLWLKVLSSNEKSEIKQQMFKAVVDDALAYKRLNNFEGSIIDSAGNEHFISWTISPLLLESKKQDKMSLVEGLLLTGYDITELKDREASFKKIDQTLKDIFSNIKEYALYVSNLDGNITYYGMGAEKMFGWQKNEIVFKHISMLHNNEDAKFQLPAILEEVKKNGQDEVEIELVKKDGQGFPVALTVSQFLDAEGKRIGYIFIAKDITERKKLEYQVFQSEKLAAIGQLAAGMTHEINNPLFVISGRLEMLLEQEGLSEKLKEDLTIVNSQADRIRKLVDRLLKFARQTAPRLEPINLNEVVEGVLPLLSYHRLPVSNVTIEKDLEKDLPSIKGDLNQLQEVFINLLINAQQATPEGGKVSVKTRNYENRVAEITISDTGCGIAPQNLKKIFIPFFSTKKEGTGLGLSICYNIIRNHSGTIDIESQLGKGTTFIIRLPFS